MTNHDDVSGIGRPPGPRQAFPPPWPSNGSHDEPQETRFPAAASQPPAATAADVDQVASIVLERIRAQLGLHQERPVEAPPADQAVALRDQAPELYELWLRIARERAATANYVERAPYEVPERLAQAGRPRALGALLIVLAFCGYLAWLGGPGPYIAGLVALVNLGAMVGIFFGLRPGLRRAARSGQRDRSGLALWWIARSRAIDGVRSRDPPRSGQPARSGVRRVSPGAASQPSAHLLHLFDAGARGCRL